MNFAIIGAGMAGLSCADALRDAGHGVALFDKGRGPGGRMSTRRLATPLGEASFDHGAQYFTARDPRFRRHVDGWCIAEIAAPLPAAGDGAWVGTPGMNSLIRHMSSTHDVAWGSPVTGIVHSGEGWRLVGDFQHRAPFDAVILAIPAEQAAAILSLHDFTMARIGLMARSQPCWTGMCVFDARLNHAADVIRDHGARAWAARNNAKPGRSGPEAWVVQATESGRLLGSKPRRSKSRPCCKPRWPRRQGVRSPPRSPLPPTVGAMRFRPGPGTAPYGMPNSSWAPVATACLVPGWNSRGCRAVCWPKAATG